MNKKIFIGIGLFWLLIIGAFIGYKEYTLATGTEVILTTQPVDPRDIFRGDYVILSYDIGRVDVTGFERGDRVFISLALDENGYATATGVHAQPPPGLFIKGRVIINPEFGVVRFGPNVEFGIESYFVPEGQGRDIERNPELEARAVIDRSGNAVLTGLLIDGEEVEFQ